MHSKVHHIIHHSIDFPILFLIICFGTLGLLYFQFQPFWQVVVTLMTCTLYSLWGIFHHYQEGNLTGEIALEYISVAALVGTILVFFLTKT